MEEIATRIKELIDTEELTNSEFAKRINVNPAIVSHILSGRNKPSLQVVESIKEGFTNVNLDYLITGNGSLYDDLTNVNSPKEVDSAFTQASAFPMEGVRVASVPGSTDLRSSPPSEDPVPEEKKVPLPGKSSALQEGNKQIEQIVIFYSDGSFKAYRP